MCVSFTSIMIHSQFYVILLFVKADPDERVPSDWENYCLEEYGLLIAEEGRNDDRLVLLYLDLTIEVAIEILKESWSTTGGPISQGSV